MGDFNGFLLYNLSLLEVLFNESLCIQEFAVQLRERLSNVPHDQAGYCSRCSSVSSIIKTFYALLKRSHNPNILLLLYLMLLYLTKLES